MRAPRKCASGSQSSFELSSCRRTGGLNPVEVEPRPAAQGCVARWEADRRDFERRLRDGEKVLPDAVISRVFARWRARADKDGQREEKRGDERLRPTREGAGRIPTRSAVRRSVTTGPAGKPAHTVRLGRMPESGKVTLKGRTRREIGRGSGMSTRPARGHHRRGDQRQRPRLTQIAPVSRQDESR
jgi:hypothetical protein